MGVTDDHNDPRLTRGPDEEPTPQAEVYLVLSAAERARGFVRPVRTMYLHITCGSVTTMALSVAETMSRCPTFYDATYCVHCRRHLPVAEFRWEDGTTVGS